MTYINIMGILERFEWANDADIVCEMLISGTCVFDYGNTLFLESLGGICWILECPRICN
jgi:hypothetical protein